MTSRTILENDRRDVFREGDRAQRFSRILGAAAGQGSDESRDGEKGKRPNSGNEHSGSDIVHRGLARTQYRWRGKPSIGGGGDRIPPTNRGKGWTLVICAFNTFGADGLNL